MYKPKEIAGLIICFLILSSLMVFGNINQCKASGETIWVDDDVIYPPGSGTLDDPFKTIQSAINAADDGDIIKVREGTYGGDLTIDKSITLTTENVHSTIIVSGSKTSYMIDITAGSVSLEGFTINDTTSTPHRKAVIHISSDINDVVVSGNIISHSLNGYGIYIDGADRTVIKNNTVNSTKGINVENSNANSIYDNDVGNCTGQPALRLSSSDTNHIENNVFRSSTYGIYAQESSYNEIRSNRILENDNSGIAMRAGKNNSIENNTIYDNDNLGIDMRSLQSSIIKNNIYENGVGISLDASGCTVRDNSIHRAGTYGVYANVGSSGNRIFNNTFHIKTGVCHAKEDGVNQWDDGRDLGNYWDDYYGPDNDNDSIGDMPYITGGVCDNYPKGVFQKPPQITNPSPAHLAAGVSKQPTLRVKVVDPEGKRMDVYFYYILDNASHLIEVVHNVESGGTASVPFFSTESENRGYTYKGLGYDYICLWYVVAKDQYSENKSSEWIFTTRHVPIDNEKPTADADGPYSGKIGHKIQFDGSGCNDIDGTIDFIRWSFGDGTSVINVESPYNIYKNIPAEPYEVSLVVIDNHGASDTDLTYVTIVASENQAPKADVNGPYAGILGESQLIQFSSSGSYDPDDDSITYYWDFGDETNSTNPNPGHDYSKVGNYTVRLTVTDGKLTDTDSTYVLITLPQSNTTPGYELILLIAAILFIFILKRKR